MPAEKAPPPSRDLTPRIDIGGTRHILLPKYLAAVPKREFGASIGSLDHERDAVLKALDLLLTGF